VGNNLIARITVSGGAKTVANTYTWGWTLQTVSRWRGIGGLLLVDDSSTQQYVPGYDGKGT